MKNRIYTVYHSLIVQEHEMTEKAYQRANSANFVFGAAIIQAIHTGFSLITAVLAALTVTAYYFTHKAKDEVQK